MLYKTHVVDAFSFVMVVIFSISEVEREIVEVQLTP